MTEAHNWEVCLGREGAHKNSTVIINILTADDEPVNLTALARVALLEKGHQQEHIKNYMMHWCKHVGRVYLEGKLG